LNAFKEPLTAKGEDNPAPAVKIVEATTASAAEEDKENDVPTPTEATVRILIITI
jgi:hypothetical protein